ncbi:MAG: response regulator [Flavisolibacter sp.]|jgi:CheY-like chemotaxis protein|nr:response regulator [Flavisolibacter sp.]
MKETERKTAKPYILYAEDDLDDYEALRGALEHETDEYDLHWVKNGEELVSFFENGEVEPPSLIVIDLNMPLMDGKQTLKWLKEQDNLKDIPAMVFTTSSREEDIKFCQSYGCSFFRKPTLYRDLLHIVQTMLRMSEIGK